MSAAPDTATAGRSRYEGFRGLIRAVGTGPRGSRSLDFDEAYAATVALLSGEVTQATTKSSPRRAGPARDTRSKQRRHGADTGRS